MKKIILAADTSNWVFSNIANHIAENSGHEVEVIYTADFSGYNGMARYLSLVEFDVCHFFWRLYYQRFVEYIKNEQDFDHLMRKRFTVSVPDFALLSNDYTKENLGITRTAAGMVFTNNALVDIYAARFPTAGVARIINDPLLLQPDPELVKARISSKKNNKFRVAWVGNGSWKGTGQYEDYKGLGTILTPILPALEKRGVEVDVIDSSRARLRQPEVMKRLEASHVLCMTSLFEGTSMPVLEAMAGGNAVVTTNTGIYPELSGKVGQASIVARNSSAFLHAISALAADRDEWEKQAHDNLDILVGSDAKRSVTQWDEFFAEVADRDPVSPQAFFTSVRSRSGSSLLAPEAAADILCVTSARDDDVHNASRMLFRNILVLPDNPDGQDDGKLETDAVVAAIDKASPDGAVVFSGGDELQQQLLSQQAAFFKTRETTLLWPGSIMQWQDKAHHEVFKFWNNQLTLGNLKGIAFIKEDIYEMFSIRRRRVALVKRWVRDDFNDSKVLRKKAVKRGLDADVPVRVAVLAAGDRVLDNPVTQIMAAGLACGGKLDVVMSCKQTFDHIQKPFNISALPIGRKLSQAEQSRALEIADVALHVTLAECSPMIPLAAVQLGIPCIVGPAANIYQGYPALEEALVVHRPDDMMEIRKKLEAVIADYPRFLQEIHQFYNAEDMKMSQAHSRYYDWCRGMPAASAG